MVSVSLLNIFNVINVLLFHKYCKNEHDFRLTELYDITIRNKRNTLSKRRCVSLSEEAGWITGYTVVMCGEGEIYADHALSVWKLAVCSNPAESNTFWLCLAAVMTCLRVQQYKQAKQRDWKPRRPVDPMVGFKHQSVCILMEMNKKEIKFALNICTTFATTILKIQ